MVQSADHPTARGIPPVVRHRDIACFDSNPEVFFPEKGIPSAPALKICGRCAHSGECLEWALDTGQAFGVWGATTPSHRRRLRKGRAA